MDILSEYLAHGKGFLSQQLLKSSDWGDDDPVITAIIFSLRSADYDSPVLLEALIEIGKHSISPSIQTVALIRFYEELPHYPIQGVVVALFEESFTLPGMEQHKKLINEKINQCFRGLCEKHSSTDLLPFFRILHPHKGILQELPELFLLEAEDMSTYQNYSTEDPGKVLDLVEKTYTISKESELHHTGYLLSLIHI